MRGVNGLGGVLVAVGRRRSAGIAGLIVFLIAAATGFEWLSDVGLGIDTLLTFGREWGRLGVADTAVGWGPRQRCHGC